MQRSDSMHSSSALVTTLSSLLEKVKSKRSNYGDAVVEYLSSDRNARFTMELFLCQPTFFIGDAQLLSQMSPPESWSRLGSGCFGTVYSATWMSLRVAVKTPLHAVSTHVGRDDGELARDCITLFEEVEISRRVRHPNIISFYVGSPHFQIMEYLPYSLDGFMRGEDVSWEEKMKWLNQATSAVKYLHAFDLVHSDIKLDHILFDENRNVRLIDLGAAYCSTIEPSYKIVSDRWAPLHLCLTVNEGLFGPSTDLYALSLLYMSIIGWTRDVHSALGIQDFERSINEAKSEKEREMVVVHCMRVAVPRAIDILNRGRFTRMMRKAALSMFVAGSHLLDSETLDTVLTYGGGDDGDVDVRVCEIEF